MKLASALYASFYPFDEFKHDDKTPFFTDFRGVSTPGELTMEDCLLVHGGADISPSLYNKAVSRYTMADAQLSNRDHAEWQLMKRAKELGIPIIGICRGAQMLCALAGGFLIQDVNNHGQSHGVETHDDKKFMVSSCHHQMLQPFSVDHVMVAKSTYRMSTHYMDVNESVEMEIEPEFVYFPKERGIAIQWHPEWMPAEGHANLFVKEKVKEYCKL